MASFSDLLSNPNRFRWINTHLEPYDQTNSTKKDLYYSNQGFTSKPGDSPSNTVYEPRIADEGFSFSRDITSGKRLRGVIRPNIGTLDLLSGETGTQPFLDSVADFVWNGRNVTIEVGGEDFSLADFETIFTGRSDGISEFTEELLSITLRDPLNQLDKPLQDRTFGGTGDLDGTSDREGQPKPWCLGRCRNVEPIPLGEIDLGDGAKLTFATGDDTDGVEKHLGVYSDGSTLTEVSSGAPGNGEWKDFEDKGVFQLGGSPAGTVITCDVDGANDGNGNYPKTAADIIEHIVNRVASNLSFKSNTISDLNNKNNNTIGWWVPENANALETIADIINSIGGYLTVNRSGEIVLGRIEAPASSAVKSFSNTEILDIRRLNVAGPLASAQVKYKRTWLVQNSSDIATSVSDDETARLNKEWRYTSKNSGASTSIFPDAKNEEFIGNFDDSSAASSEASRLATLHGTERKVYEVILTGQALERELGETVKITSDRFNLGSGQKFVIVGIEERAPFIDTKLIVWG